MDCEHYESFHKMQGTTLLKSCFSLEAIDHGITYVTGEIELFWSVTFVFENAVNLDNLDIIIEGGRMFSRLNECTSNLLH